MHYKCTMSDYDKQTSIAARVYLGWLKNIVIIFAIFMILKDQ